MSASQDDFSFRLVEWLLDHQLESHEGVTAVSTQFATIISQAQPQSRENLNTHIAQQIFRKATAKATDSPINLCARVCYSLLLNSIKHGLDHSIRITRIHEYVFNLCVDSVRTDGSANSIGNQGHRNTTGDNEDGALLPIGNLEATASPNLDDTSLDHVSHLVVELYNLGLICIANVYEYLRCLATSSATIEARLGGFCILFEACTSAPDIGPWKTEMGSILQWALNAVSKYPTTDSNKNRIEAIARTSTFEGQGKKSPGTKYNPSDSSSSLQTKSSNVQPTEALDVHLCRTVPMSSPESRTTPDEWASSGAGPSGDYAEVDDHSLSGNNRGKHPVEQTKEDRFASRARDMDPRSPPTYPKPVATSNTIPSHPSSLPAPKARSERPSPLSTSTVLPDPRRPVPGPLDIPAAREERVSVSVGPELGPDLAAKGRASSSQLGGSRPRFEASAAREDIPSPSSASGQSTTTQSASQSGVGGGVGGGAPRDGRRTRGQRGNNLRGNTRGRGRGFQNPSTRYVAENLEPVAPAEHNKDQRETGSTSHTTQQADMPQLVEREVRALLNKLAMNNFDSISDQIIQWANKSEREKDGWILMQVIKLVFERAKDDEERSAMYARLCRKMMEHVSPNVQDEMVRNAEGQPIKGGMLFRRYLLNWCQYQFERRRNAKEPTGEASNPDGPYAATKAKGQYLGLVQFIGELFKLQMLTERTMHEIIKKLVSNVVNPEQGEIKSLCKLLTIVGQSLDNPKARNHVDIYFERIQEMMNGRNIDLRMWTMLQDVVDLRARNWQN